MKYWWVVLIIAILLILFTPKDKIEITTTVKKDTVGVIDTNKVETVMRDTVIAVKPDSNFVIPKKRIELTDGYITTEFDLLYADSAYTFSNVFHKGVEFVKTYRDSFFITERVTVEKHFYEDHWFWTALGFIILTIMLVLK